MEKELKNVPGMGSEDVVVIKKFTYGDKSFIAGKVTKVKPREKEPEINIDVEAARIYTIVRGVARASFFAGCKTTEDRVTVVENLDEETGAFLFKEIGDFNKPIDLKEEQK